MILKYNPTLVEKIWNETWIYCHSMRENCSQISSHYFFYQGQDEYLTSEKMLRKNANPGY